VHGCCVQMFLGMPLTLGDAIVDMYVSVGAYIYKMSVLCDTQATMRDVIAWMR
jgi:hypothetical protein